MLQTKQGANPRTDLPSGFKDYQANGFAIAFPSTWQAGMLQQGGSLYIVPQQGGVNKMQNGSAELIAGAMIDYYVPQAGAGAPAARPHFARSTSTPGSGLPSIHSRKAPPAVEM